MKWLQAAVLLVAAAHFVNLLPVTLNFDRFAFGDCGWPLAVDALMTDDGLKPVTDFGYFYGLLTLVVDRAAFAVFGRTPGTVVGLYGVCALGIAVGAVRIMASANLRLLPSLYLVVCAALITIPRGFPSPAHALEAALLMCALADHAAGRLGRALALVVVAVFVKPSLGYVYGLILLVLILTGWPGGASRWKRLLPALGVGVLLASGLSILYGWKPLLDTQLPFVAMEAYRDAGFGFFRGTGQGFWLPEEPTFEYYRDSIPGLWLASSVVLLVSAIRLLPRFREPTASLVLIFAVLHFTFVCLLFGNRWSWIYYPYLLFVGTAVALNTWPRLIRVPLTAALVVVAILGQAEEQYGNYDAWSGSQPSSATGGLFAPPSEAVEWNALRVLATKTKVLVLTRMGCPHILAPELDGPRWWCLIRRTMSDDEKRRALEQIAAAEVVISPDWHDNDLWNWSEFKPQQEHFELERETPFFKQYRRRP